METVENRETLKHAATDLLEGALDPASSSRRMPTQRRSRERLERILTVATDLIVQKGSDALKMSEVAALTEISIGSLYQYFPDKSAIIQTLAERYNAQGRACVEAELLQVSAEPELLVALERVVDGYYALFLEEPAMRDLWAATQVDRALQDMDAADGEAHAMMLFDLLKRLRPTHDSEALYTLALLTMQLLATAVRLAISLERVQGDAVIETFKQMLSGPLLTQGLKGEF